jgi:hypothetical protein
MSFISKAFEEHVKATTKSMLDTLVSRTPIDTTFAQSNWSIAPFAPTRVETLKNTASKAEVAKAKAMSEQSFKQFLSSPIKNFSFVNNAEYIQELEDGKSDQAPNGFIRPIVNRFK